MVAHGSNQAFRRETFIDAGSFDEKLNVLEDNELPNRIKGRGKVVFDRSAWTVVSSRRFDREGYVGPTIKYFSAYWNIYVLRKRTELEYKAVR
jgi:hypothetical protein